MTKQTPQVVQTKAVAAVPMVTSISPPLMYVMVDAVDVAAECCWFNFRSFSANANPGSARERGRCALWRHTSCLQIREMLWKTSAWRAIAFAYSPEMNFPASDPEHRNGSEHSIRESSSNDEHHLLVPAPMKTPARSQRRDRMPPVTSVQGTAERWTLCVRMLQQKSGTSKTGRLILKVKSVEVPGS